MQEPPRPSPHDQLVVYNPLNQPFTIEYEHRFWTIDPHESAAHPRYLAEQFAGQMATAVINRMGDDVRARIMQAQPQISLPDLNTELLKREPRTNNLELREKIIRKVVVGVEALYPLEKERPEDPKEGAVKAGIPYYNEDQKIIMKITNADYARLAGIGADKEVIETTSKVTTDIGFLEEATPAKPLQPTTKLESKPEEKPIKKEEPDLFKEVVA
jgi:hypothetical protein